MKFALGRKQNMTQIFDEAGRVSGATVVRMTPLTVTHVKTKEKDGYSAVQVGFGSRKPKNVSKAVKGHLKDLPSFEVLREVKTADAHTRGETVVADFKVGDTVTISAISKGKGFQGVVKRHGFHGGPRSHGQKHSEREPGSISGGTRNGGRVPKGMRMAGRMGTDRITLKNVKIVHIDAVKNEFYLRGAVPGRRGTLVEIKG